MCSLCFVYSPEFCVHKIRIMLHAFLHVRTANPVFFCYVLICILHPAWVRMCVCEIVVIHSLDMIKICWKLRFFLLVLCIYFLHREFFQKESSLGWLMVHRAIILVSPSWSEERAVETKEKNKKKIFAWKIQKIFIFRKVFWFRDFLKNCVRFLCNFFVCMCVSVCVHIFCKCVAWVVT